jgi:septal ring factor EnvC (AmiA/AmiB activator)
VCREALKKLESRVRKLDRALKEAQQKIKTLESHNSVLEDRLSALEGNNEFGLLSSGERHLTKRSSSPSGSFKMLSIAITSS